TEREIEAALGHTEGNPMAIVIGFAGPGLIGKIGDASRGDGAMAELREARIRGDEAIKARRIAAPESENLPVRGQVGDLDLGSQPIKGQPLDEVGNQPRRQVEQEALPIGKNDEIEKDLALRG